MDLSQAKHAFITGGASGIGLAIGGELVADAIGNDLPYVLTHPEYWPAIEQRQKAVEAVFRASS